MGQAVFLDRNETNIKKSGGAIDQLKFIFEMHNDFYLFYLQVHLWQKYLTAFLIFLTRIFSNFSRLNDFNSTFISKQKFYDSIGLLPIEFMK